MTQSSLTPSGIILSRSAAFALGHIVRHNEHAFRGVVVDVDATFNGAIDGPRPDNPDQPFYRVMAIGEEAGFMVYAAENVLERDPDLAALEPRDAAIWFTVDAHGHHAPRSAPIH